MIGDVLAAAAGLSMGVADLTTAGLVAAVVVFALVAAVSVALPVVLHAILGERVLGPLGKAKDWLQANNATVMTVVIAVLGALLVVKGIGGL